MKLLVSARCAGPDNPRKVEAAGAKALCARDTARQFARCKAMSEVGSKADLPVERPDFSL